jgi:hypothetical protein
VGPEWLKKSDFIRQLNAEKKKKMRRRERKHQDVHMSEQEQEQQGQEQSTQEEGSLRVECGQEVWAIRDVGTGDDCSDAGDLRGWTNWKAVGTGEGGAPLSRRQQEHAEALLAAHWASSSACFYPLYVLTSRDEVLFQLPAVCDCSDHMICNAP